MIISEKECTQEKSKAQNVLDIVSYIAKVGEHICMSDAVDYIKTINCKNNFSTYESTDALLLEIVAQAEVSVRSGNPFQHLVLSWPEGEIPTNKQIDEAVKITLQELGYENCQIIYAVHKNTKYKHCHLFINRVDLLTDKVCNDSFSHDKMNRAMAKIDALQGWQSPLNAIYEYNATCDEFIKKREPQPDQNLSARALAYEVYTGYQCAERVIKKYVDEILNCDSWENVQFYLAEHGMSIDKAKNGSVFTILFDGGSMVAIKPSKISRKLSYKNLVVQWGDFKKYEIEIIPHPLMPVNSDNETLLKNIYYNINKNIENEYNESLEITTLYPMPQPAVQAMRQIINEEKEKKKRKNKENFEQAQATKKFVKKLVYDPAENESVNLEEYYSQIPASFENAKISFVDSAVLFDFGSFILRDSSAELSLLCVDEETQSVGVSFLHELTEFKDSVLNEAFEGENGVEIN